MKYLSIIWFLTCLSLLFVPACVEPNNTDETDTEVVNGEELEEDDPMPTNLAPSLAITTENLNGRWEMVAAKRNGRSTSSLDQAFFEFYDDGQMETNLLGEVMEGNYELEGRKLLQTSPQEIEYKVIQLGDSTLILDMNMQGHHFHFQLAKLSEDEEELE